ncbi:MAG: response regulator [Bacteroidetes bacterium]|nr:response regulator [Bacteroidota bacterium]
MAEKRILVIEDEPFIRKSIVSFLELEKYNVTSVSTVRRAIHYIEANEFDLVITDIMLPYSGGFEIIEHLKTHPWKSVVPVVILTGMDKDVMNATYSEADAYLFKPFSPKELLDTVKLIFGK